MDELKQALKQAFANSFAFYLKAHYFHWNVEGMLFSQFHDFFGNIYQEVYASIDPFAENIRKIKSYTPASLYRFSALSAVDDETEILDPQAMVAELLRDAEKMQEIMKVLFQESEARREHGLSDFLAGRQDAFAKHAWFLRSTAKV
jgi:starvation-inducible DNA-binding protein